jgi:hypothetical protein
MSKKHRVIIIPGLGDDVNKMSWVIRLWRRHGLEPMIHSIGWHDGKKFQPKLRILIEMIDQFTQDGDRISLVGCSAGASAALNAFIERKNVLHRVINVCGRLRSGNQLGFRSFAARTVTSPSFAQSIKLFEKHEHLLSNQDRQKIMTVRALFGDELVPTDTTILRGAYNTVIPTLEHALSIAMAVTLFSRPLITFLKKEDK